LGQFSKNYRRIIELLPKQLSLSSQKYGIGIWNPGSVIREKPISDPGSRGQKGTRSRIPNPGSKAATLVVREKS
jgi:hypothetical protein